jgi:hypothetical protein
MELDDDDAVGRWTLTAEDHALVMAKNVTNRLGFARCSCFIEHMDGFPGSRRKSALGPLAPSRRSSMAASSARRPASRQADATQKIADRQNLRSANCRF